MAIIEIHGQGGRVLRDAVFNASAGDTIQVYGDPTLPYIYVTDNIGVTIIGMNGRENCIIDGEHVYDESTDTHTGNRCATGKSNTTSIIQSFTLRNGYSGTGRGGAVSNAKVIDCIITSCYANADGGGAYNCNIENSIIEYCTSTGGGGGVNVGTVINCDIHNNYAFNGGGTFKSTVTDSRIRNNTAENYAGGIYGGNLTNCILSYNTSSSVGGGVYNCNVDNSTIEYCESARGGGGYFSAGHIITDCVIHNCKSTGAGGGLYGQAKVNNCEISNNVANGYGAAAYSAICTNCYIHGNINTKEDGVYICYGTSYDRCLIFNSVVGSISSSTVISDKRNCYYYGGGSPVIRNCIFYFIGESGFAMQGHNTTDRINYENCLFYPAVSKLVDAEAKKILNGVDPKLNSTYHLKKGSPCIGAGNAEYLQSTTDLDGKAWKTPPSIGCYEFYELKKQYMPSSLHPLGL